MLCTPVGRNPHPPPYPYKGVRMGVEGDTHTGDARAHTHVLASHIYVLNYA